MTNCQDQIDGNKDGFLKNQKSLLQNGYNITDMYRNGNIGKMYKNEYIKYESMSIQKKIIYSERRLLL